MTTDSAGLVELDRSESMRRLSTQSVGRIVYTAAALPVVHPVNFIVEGDSIVICTNSASKLAVAGRQEIVAFEVDEINAVSRGGWTVIVTGRASEVTDAFETARLTELLSSWLPDTCERFVAIRTEIVTGRELPPLLP